MRSNCQYFYESILRMEHTHGSYVEHTLQSVIALLSRSRRGLQGHSCSVCSSVVAHSHFTFLIGFYAGLDLEITNMMFNCFSSAYCYKMLSA